MPNSAQDYPTLSSYTTSADGLKIGSNKPDEVKKIQAEWQRCGQCGDSHKNGKGACCDNCIANDKKLFSTKATAKIGIVVMGKGKSATHFLYLPHGSNCKLPSRATASFIHYALHVQHELENDGMVLDIQKMWNPQGQAQTAFRMALRTMTRGLNKEALFHGEEDPETGDPIEIKEETKKKKGADGDTLRRRLPANRCVFCKNETDRAHTCGCCGESRYAVCSTCLKLGAPDVHAPSRMSKVYTKNEKEPIYVCYPKCVRKAAFQCSHCNKKIDKTLVHKFIRQIGNVNTCICDGCATSKKITVCTSCHSITSKHKEYETKSGWKCDRCFERNLSFDETDKEFEVITKREDARTFGVELEINNVHHAGWLAETVADMNIGGVEFNVKEDGSVHQGLEIVSFPADRQTLLRALRPLCRVMNTFKHSYEDTGLHVHVADPKRNPIDAFKLWGALEHMTFAILPPRRARGYGSRMIDNRGGSINELLKVQDEEDAINYQCRYHAGMSQRYTSLNALALDEHGTLEARCHHGTADYRAIAHWITYLNAIWERAGKYDDEQLKGIYTLAKAHDWKAIADELRLPKRTTAYYQELKEQYVRFGDDASPSYVKRSFIIDGDIEDDGAGRFDLKTGSFKFNATYRKSVTAKRRRTEQEERRLLEHAAQIRRMEPEEYATPREAMARLTTQFMAYGPRTVRVTGDMAIQPPTFNEENTPF